MFRQCGIFCFSIGLWKCSDNVVFFVFLLDFGNVPTVWYFLFFYWILEMFRQCGIFCFSIGFWKCSDSVVFVVFLLDFGNVPTVWYFFLVFLLDFLFFYWILEMFRQCGIFCFSIVKCSDSVVFFVFLLDFGNVSDSVVFFDSVVFVPTVGLFFYWMFRQCVFFVFLLEQCGIFSIDSVEFFCGFSIGFYWKCSDSVVFLFFLFFYWYFLFFYWILEMF